MQLKLLERQNQMRLMMGRQEKERLAPRSDKLVQELNGMEQMRAQCHLELETEWPMARPVNQPQNLQQSQGQMFQYMLEPPQTRYTAVQAAGQLEAHQMILQGQPSGESLAKRKLNMALRTPSEERHNIEPIGQSSQRSSFDAHFLQTNQNLANSLQGGVANPSTFEFQRAATDADAERHMIQAQQGISFYSKENGLDVKPPSSQYNQIHEANDAANGLYLLAQTQTPPKNGAQQPSQAQVSPPHRAFVWPSQLLPASSANLTPPELNSEYSNNSLHLPLWSDIQSRALSNSTYPRNEMSQSHIGVETYDPRLHLQSSAPGIPSNNRKIFATVRPCQQLGRVNSLKEERDIDRSNDNPKSDSPLTFVPSAPLEEASSAMGSPHSIQYCIAPASERPIHSLELDSNPRASSTFQSSSSSLRPQFPQPPPPPYPLASLSSPPAHHLRRHASADIRNVQGWQENFCPFASSQSSSTWQPPSK
jgi:hypothetical protein